MSSQVFPYSFFSLFPVSTIDPTRDLFTKHPSQNIERTNTISERYRYVRRPKLLGQRDSRGVAIAKIVISIDDQNKRPMIAMTPGKNSSSEENLQKRPLYLRWGITAKNAKVGLTAVNHFPLSLNSSYHVNLTMEDSHSSIRQLRCLRKKCTIVRRWLRFRSLSTTVCPDFMRIESVYDTI